MYLCMSISTYMCVRIKHDIILFIHTYNYTCILHDVQIYTYTYMYVYVHVYVSACVSPCVCVCVGGVCLVSTCLSLSLSLYNTAT